MKVSELSLSEVNHVAGAGNEWGHKFTTGLETISKIAKLRDNTNNWR